MISPLIIIASITLLIAVSINSIFKSDYGWFNRLRRPQWLTFEWAIPFIWIFVFICGVYSAYQLWIKKPGTTETWLFMAGYLLLEVLFFYYCHHSLVIQLRRNFHTNLLAFFLLIL